MADMERMFERLLEGLALLTQQVARLAYATERGQHLKEVHKTCRACSSCLQRHDAKRCLACGEFMGDG